MYHGHPWTFSFSHPLTDVECVDDTVLIARTNETLSWILHLLQHLAARISLLLNGSKCQLLTIHASLPRFSFAPCRCFLPMQLPLLRSFLSYHSWSGSPDTPLTPLTSAKYLGSYITPTSSSVPDVNFRCSQASSAFKLSIHYFFRRPLLSLPTVQTPSLYPDCSGHSRIWVPDILSSPHC